MNQLLFFIFNDIDKNLSISKQLLPMKIMNFIYIYVLSIFLHNLKNRN